MTWSGRAGSSQQPHRRRPRRTVPGAAAARGAELHLDARPEWDAALKKIDPDWNPSWSADWQRHYAARRELVAVTVNGMDIGWPGSASTRFGRG